MPFMTSAQSWGITAWSAVSPFGYSPEDFAAGIRSGHSTRQVLDHEAWNAPSGDACLVPGFHPCTVLGRKGTRSMDRATGLAVAAVRQMTQPDPSRPLCDSSDVGLVLGTSMGSVSSIMEFTRASLTESKPYFVDVSRFPNTVMNCAAAQTAIWHKLRGPNVTIAGGRASALLALQYALRLLQSGRAARVVFGSVEEFSGQRAWLDWHARREHETAMPTGEGCAVMLLERSSTRAGPVLAELRAVELGFSTVGDDGHVLARCVRRALAAASIDVGAIWAVAPSGLPGHHAIQEGRALDDVLEGKDRRFIGCSEFIGDTGAASVAFQLAAVLAVAASEPPEEQTRMALVTTVDPDGVVGCAIFEIGASAEGCL
jgi:3-oxoacyl-[acyl-carrier-protein] synthase II